MTLALKLMRVTSGYQQVFTKFTTCSCSVALYLTLLPPVRERPEDVNNCFVQRANNFDFLLLKIPFFCHQIMINNGR